jgi:hypothetical protein
MAPGAAVAEPNAVTESGPGVPDSTYPVEAAADGTRTRLILTKPQATTRMTRTMDDTPARRRRIGRRKDFTSQIYREGIARTRRLVFL